MHINASVIGHTQSVIRTIVTDLLYETYPIFYTSYCTISLYGKILFGVLHLLRASIATSDTPQGMNPSGMSNQIASNSVRR